MSQQSRRHFLKALSVFGAAGIGNFGLNLATMASASAQSSNSDYKAIVCFFMSGGNDQTNFLIPYDNGSYNSYQELRPAIAIPQSTLNPLNILNVTDGRQFALHPQLGSLANLFDQGKIAMLANVGTLITPVTKTQYINRSVPLPAKLFSHNDQQSTWQSLSPEGASFGWAGQMGDLLQSNNGNVTFTCVSAAGSQVMLSGRNVRSYPVGSDGAATMTSVHHNWFGSSNSASTMKELMTQDRDNLYEKEMAAVLKRSIDASSILGSSLNSAASYALPADLANISIAKQLRIVARIISIQASLGMKRQIFFVNMGGFDTHSNQLAQHNVLYNQLSRSLEYFYNCTVSMGLQDNVTTFSASDFGRTGISNGGGSDHGWGSHHFIMGGAVNGKNLYGQFPIVGSNSPDDIGSGRLIPTTSVDQYAATLGKWLGVSDSDLSIIFPNLRNFNNKNLGIFKT